MKMLPGQLSLFDTVSAPVQPAPYSCPIEHPDLDRYALLWTATERGNATGIRFAMTVEDAMAWCESPLSKGYAHQTAWAYFWTRVSSWMKAWSADHPIDVFEDDGTWDERIAAVGLTKVGFAKFAEKFRPLGVKIAYPAVERRNIDGERL